MSGAVTVVGSSNLDLVMKMARLPKPGETVTEATFTQAFGGKGANQAVGAVRAGAAVRFVTALGDDQFGDAMLLSYQNDGINTQYITREPETPSGTALIMVDEKGENIISVAPGANDKLTPENVNEAAEAFDGAGVVLLQFEVPASTVARAIERGSDAGATVIWNVAPVRSFDHSILRKVDVLVVNETEAQFLSGSPVTDAHSATAAAGKLQEMGPDTVIVTLGSDGSVVKDRDNAQVVPAYRVTAVDTTAAGDVYCGCLATALADGRTLDDAVRFASAGAALSVQRLGAQPSAPARPEIEAFISQA